jgi:hypothetical protein
MAPFVRRSNFQRSMGGLVETEESVSLRDAVFAATKLSVDLQIEYDRHRLWPVLQPSHPPSTKCFQLRKRPTVARFDEVGRSAPGAVN